MRPGEAQKGRRLLCEGKNRKRFLELRAFVVGLERRTELGHADLGQDGRVPTEEQCRKVDCRHQQCRAA